MNIWKLCNLTEKFAILNGLPRADRAEITHDSLKNEALKYYMYTPM